MNRGSHTLRETNHVRQSSYSYEDLLACGRGELFGSGNAQLPLPPMLMFDRITEISEDGGEHGLGCVRAELDIKKDLWFFPCHRPDGDGLSFQNENTRLNVDISAF